MNIVKASIPQEDIETLVNQVKPFFTYIGKDEIWVFTKKLSLTPLSHYFWEHYEQEIKEQCDFPINLDKWEYIFDANDNFWDELIESNTFPTRELGMEILGERLQDTRRVNAALESVINSYNIHN